MNAAEKITRARSQLIMSQPFFGCLALHLEVKERRDLKTMATDGRHLFYSPAFVGEITERQLVGVIAHEVYHCALAHHARMGNRDLKDWNRAADYAINPELVKAGFELPPGCLMNPDFAGLGAEEIYAILKRQPPQQQQPEPQPGSSKGQAGGGQPQQGNGAPQAGQPQQPGPAGRQQPGTGQAGAGQQQQAPGSDDDMGMGGVLPSPSPAEAAAEADRWDVLTRQAVNVAKAHNAGNVPGFLERLVAELNAPRVDFRELLARWIDSRVVSDYSFSRPNRRFAHAGVYLPGQVIDGLGHVVFAVDTSGSVNGDMLRDAMSEPVGALESGKIDRLTVIMADRKVHAVHEYTKGDDIDAVPVGGGGTHFGPTFDWIEREAPDATAVVYLTDLDLGGQVARFGRDPGMPVLWAVYGDSRKFDGRAAVAPFGEAIYIGRL